MNISEDFYTSKIVNKPWGFEYVIYNDKKKLGITFLKINKDHKTSLHCHTNKKTGFIILGGNAEVQYGIYSHNKKIMIRFSKLRIRKPVRRDPKRLGHMISQTQNLKKSKNFIFARNFE